jgi:hypothetical protein
MECFRISEQFEQIKVVIEACEMLPWIAFKEERSSKVAKGEVGSQRVVRKSTPLEEIANRKWTSRTSRKRTVGEEEICVYRNSRESLQNCHKNENKIVSQKENTFYKELAKQPVLEMTESN